MPYFDRFDVCEAHYLIECHYHVGGWLHERPSNRTRGLAKGYVGQATHVQLFHMGFTPRPSLELDTLTENGLAIYRELERRYGFDKF